MKNIYDPVNKLGKTAPDVGFFQGIGQEGKPGTGKPERIAEKETGTR
jgi:hypothetical protein